MEDDGPKAALIDLLTQQSSTPQAVEGALHRAAKAEALLRAELVGMRLVALQRRAVRAVAEGVDADEVDESGDPTKASLVALVLDGRQDQSGSARPRAAAPARRGSLGVVALHGVVDLIRVNALGDRADRAPLQRH